MRQLVLQLIKKENNMEDKQDGDPKFKFVRKEEEKIKRRRREKLKRLSNKIREFMEEEPDVPVVFLHTLNGKTEGHVSPWLRDICGDFSTQMASASMAHHADMLLSAKEYKVPTAEEEWKNLLSLNAVETPEAILRKILPLILKGIVQGKNIWKGPRPEGWPASIPFQDPNRTINHRKLGAEDLRKIFNSFQVFHCIDVPEQPSACNVNDGSAFLEKESISSYKVENLMNKCKFNDVQQLMDKMPSPEVVASVVATHTSTKTLREAFMAHKTFPVALVQPGGVNREGFAKLLQCKSIRECFNMYAPCSQAHLDLLMRVQGILHMGHYVQQYERVVSGGVKPQVICDLLGISGGDDMLKCFEDAMTNSNDRFRLLLLAGALEINIKLHENKQVISFPPCPCVPSAKQTLEIVRSEGCYNLLVPVSFLAGCNTPNPTPQVIEKLRLPGMDNVKDGRLANFIIVNNFRKGVHPSESHRIEMGIDLYEVDMVSLHPMRWLTDAIIDVATRRMKEDLGTENVFILNTAFAQKLLVKGKLNRRPLNMSGCNYVGVEDTLTNIELKDGTIILVPISNMLHWYLGALSVMAGDFGSISIICSMSGSYVDEESSLRVFFEKELEKAGRAANTVIVQHTEVPQQKNSYDCGVYLLSFVRNILQNQSLSHLSDTVILTRNEVSNLCFN